jgi:hypothetical protein
VDFKATGQLVIVYYECIKYMRKMGIGEPQHRLLLDIKKSYDLVEREVFCNSLIEFGIPMKIERLTE